MQKNKNIMKNLVDISLMVTQSTNFFEIKDKIIDKMLEVIQPTKACLNLFCDNDYEYAYLVCSSTLEYVPKLFEKNCDIGVKLDFEKEYPEYIQEAVRDKKIIYIENIFDNPKAISERELAQKEKYVGRIVFPLVLNYNVVGFMTCFLSEDDSIDETDITFISSVVSLITLSIDITMENSHTKEIINTLRDSISNVNELIAELYLNNDVNMFMEGLNNKAKKLTKSSEAFIIIDDLNYEYKIFSTMKNTNRKKIDFQKILLRISEFEEDGSYQNNVENLILGDISIKNYIYYKLKEGNNLVGCVLCASDNPYSDDDFNILELLSKQAILGMQLYKYNQAETKHKLIANELNILNKQQKLIMNKAEMDLSNDKDLYFYHRAATVVGGDFYHAQKISENKVAYIVADVMGHGIVSNYIVAMVKGSFKTLCHQYERASDIMNRLNQILYDEFDEMGVFTTCIVTIVDTENNSIDISNAGHYCPIMIDKKGNVVSNKDDKCQKNIPLGVLEHIQYGQTTRSIENISVVCMYTDGIIELKNNEKEEYGVERFKEFLAKNYRLSKDEFINALKREMDDFTHKNNFDDDILIVCLNDK